MRTKHEENKARTARPRTWRVHLSLESTKLRITPAVIRKVLREILRHAETDIAIPHVNEINVMFINDARMREINFEFRKKDKPTDVLSFPQFAPREISGKQKVKEVSGTYLGDLVISTETTLRQAKRFGVTRREELVRLLVHGVLHLCGYDHEKVPAKEANRMRRRERVIRAAVLARQKS